MFDPRDPRERLWWHYDSRRPLSMAQIIAVRSVDAQTAALIWLLLEHGASLTIAGPTDPQPGIGKTSTLNALLQFVPEDSALAYMSGMYEDFAFTQLPDIEPDHTYALCNEVSDHLPIYMWGRVARRYLTTHFLQAHADAKQPDTVVPLPLSLWNEFDDTFEHADQPILDELAQWACMTPAAFAKALKLRTECLEELSQSGGVGMHQMYDAINDLRKREKKG